MRVTLYEVTQRWQKLFIEDQPVTARVRGNDGRSFIERDFESFRIADRLIFANQAEFIAHVAKEWQLAFGQCAIEGLVLRIGRVELFGIGQHFDEHCAGIGATMHFVD